MRQAVTRASLAPYLSGGSAWGICSPPDAFLRVSLFLTSILFLHACSDIPIGSNKPPSNDNVGAVAGRLCSPSGDAWLADAYVYTNIMDDEGFIYDLVGTFSDRDGYFLLDRIPASSEATLHVQKNTYESELTAEVRKGELTTLAEPDCFAPLSYGVAVVSGEFDSFSEILDAVGVTNYLTIDGLDEGSSLAFFEDPELLASFDLICVDAGIQEEGIFDQPGLADNVAAYVEGGGKLFVSDWSYDVIERAFPEYVDFWGDDEAFDAAQVGLAELVTGNIVDQSLAAFLGGQSVEIRYDLGYWPVITGADPTVLIHIMGDVQVWSGAEESSAVPAVPLLLSFSHGYGSVLFSSFREEANVNEDIARILEYMLYRL